MFKCYSLTLAGWLLLRKMELVDEEKQGDKFIVIFDDYEQCQIQKREYIRTLRGDYNGTVDCKI